MSLLDWNSIENSRHGITDSYRGPSKTIPLPLNDVRRVFPPFIEYTEPENTYLSFQVTFKTEIHCKYSVPNWLKRTHDVIMPRNYRVMSNCVTVCLCD